MKCPICNNESPFLIEKKDKFGQLFCYFICNRCRFIFDEDLYGNNAKLQKKVSVLYEGDYFHNIDSGWKSRCDGVFKIIKNIVKIYSCVFFKKNVSVLDYGGGNGYLVSKLGKDFNVFYYDKYAKPEVMGTYRVLEKPIKADIIYAVELVEHITNMREWDFLNKLSPNVFIFTTCLSDNIKDKDIRNWSYIIPNAGHVALYSTKAIQLLAKKHGYIYLFFPNISCHIFVKNKFLSQINFVGLEYFIYNIFRKIKNLLV